MYSFDIQNITSILNFLQRDRFNRYAVVISYCFFLGLSPLLQVTDSRVSIISSSRSTN